MSEKVFYTTKDSVRICALLDEPKVPAKGSVILAHGITTEKTEDGIFTQLSESLCYAGFNVLCFDFRGHGESGGTPEDMTIAGEVLDLKASIDYATKTWGKRNAVVAASFGAVSAIIHAASAIDISCMVLWNPVLDLKKTFLEPTLPWAKNSFNAENNGYMLLDNFFKLGDPLVKEMSRLNILEESQKIKYPVLTIHGDQDTYVSYQIAYENYKFNACSEFLSIIGSEHGFGRIQDKNIVIPHTVQWIDRFLP
jgi:uncharacterized protein